MCEDPNCHSNNPSTLVMCPECLERLIMVDLSVEEVADMFIQTEEMFKDGSFSNFIKSVLPYKELLDIDEKELDANIEDFRDNMASIYNQILLRKISQE